MANLKQVYAEGRDVRDSDIPEMWKESFGNFMMGQTCQAETNEDGTVKEFIYYACDFRMWYFQNKEAIERDIKIDQVYE
jgi:hypothetical protein